MKGENLYSNLLEELRKRVPEKSELVKMVTQTLLIQKESAYRRLRGDIPFTLNEAGVMASRLGISLDDLMSAGERKMPGVTYVAVPLHTSEENYNLGLLKRVADLCSTIVSHPDSEHGMASNSLPAIFYLPLRNLTRFFVFKWSHSYSVSESLKPYSDTRLSEQAEKLSDELMDSYSRMGRTLCIIEPRIIEDILYDLRYYEHIKLVTPEESRLVADDLSAFLDDFQYMAQYGRFRETGNRLDIYLSDVTIGSGYTYSSGGGTQLSGLTSFIFQSAMSTRPEAFSSLRDWVYYLRQMSTSVSVVGVKERVAFVDRQRRLLDEFYARFE